MVVRISAPPFSGRSLLSTPDLHFKQHANKEAPLAAPTPGAVPSFYEAREAGKVKPVKVKLVDAFALRNRSLDWQEFGAFATHLQFPKIPLGEVWVDQNIEESERNYLILAAEAQYWAHKHGKDSDDAYEYGLTVERSERERNTERSGGDRPFHHEVIGGVYQSLWKVLIDADGDPVYVWIVNGTTIRDINKTDFVEGGSAYIYPFLPSDEIWIEDAVDPAERPFVLLHEFTERNLMKNELADYDDAHKRASQVEFAARKKYAGTSKKTFGDDFYRKGNLFGLEETKKRPDRGLSNQAHGDSLPQYKSVRGVELPAEAERREPEHEEPPPARRQSAHAPVASPQPPTPAPPPTRQRQGETSRRSETPRVPAQPAPAQQQQRQAPTTPPARQARRTQLDMGEEGPLPVPEGTPARPAPEPDYSGFDRGFGGNDSTREQASNEQEGLSQVVEEIERPEGFDDEDVREAPPGHTERAENLRYVLRAMLSIGDTTAAVSRFDEAVESYLTPAERSYLEQELARDGNGVAFGISPPAVGQTAASDVVYRNARVTMLNHGPEASASYLAFEEGQMSPEEVSYVRQRLADDPELAEVAAQQRERKAALTQVRSKLESSLSDKFADVEQSTDYHGMAQFTIPNGDGRAIFAKTIMANQGVLVDIAFARHEHGANSFHDYLENAPTVQKGTMALMRKLTGLIDTLATQGIGATYFPADEQRERVYARAFERAGWRKVQGSRRHHERYIWTPPATVSGKALESNESDEQFFAEQAQLYQQSEATEAKKESTPKAPTAPKPVAKPQQQPKTTGNVSSRAKRPTVPSPEQAPRTPETPPPALPGTEPALTPAGRQPGPRSREDNLEHAQSQVMGNVPTVHKEKIPVGDPDAVADGTAEWHTTEQDQAGIQEPQATPPPDNVQEIRQEVRAASEQPRREAPVAGKTSRSAYLLEELLNILGNAQSDADVTKAVSTFEESEEGFLTAAESDYIRTVLSPVNIGKTVAPEIAERFSRGIGGSKNAPQVAAKPSPQPKPRLFAYGGRKADEEQEEQAKRDVGRFLKKQYPETLFAAVGNGVDDGEVEVYFNNYPGAVNWEKPGKGSVEVITRGGGVYAKRIIGRNNGQLVIKNSIFKIEKDSPYKGSGFEFFVNQVAALQKMGVTKIYTHAAGKPNDPDGYNGYYTWPRMGYDGTIQRSVLEKMPPELRQQLGSSRSVFDLFSLPGGKEWWNKNGADIVDAFFDLTPGSRNLKRLEEYQTERRNKGK